MPESLDQTIQRILASQQNVFKISFEGNPCSINVRNDNIINFLASTKVHEQTKFYFNINKIVVFLLIEDGTNEHKLDKTIKLIELGSCTSLRLLKWVFEQGFYGFILRHSVDSTDFDVIIVKEPIPFSYSTYQAAMIQ